MEYLEVNGLAPAPSMDGNSVACIQEEVVPGVA